MVAESMARQCQITALEIWIWPAQLHLAAFPPAIINRNSPVEAEDTADWVGELTGWDDWKWGGG